MRSDPDPGELSALVARQTGLEPVGGFAFSADPTTADRLLGLVLHGPKRAFAALAVDLGAGRDPWPQPGQLWFVRNGTGAPRAVVVLEELRIAPLYSVDAAFAWEAGEDDRTRAAWLAARELDLHGQGLTHLEGEHLAFQRFSLVWPTADQPTWWLPGVRELRGHEAAPDGPRPDLPALVAFEEGRIAGVLRFEPEPDELRVVAVSGSPATEARLREALELRRAADRTRI